MPDGSVLASLPDPARHGGDQRRTLPAAVFRLEEANLAFWRELLNCFVHHGGEAEGQTWRES